MTPYQLNIAAKNFNEQKKAADEDKLILTWLGAYWQRVKKMPTLKEVLNPTKPKKQNTPEEMLEEVKRLNEALGGTIY
jgi:hypothetical protein